MALALEHYKKKKTLKENKTMKKLATIAVTFLVVGAFAASAFAFGPGWGRGHGGGPWYGNGDTAVSNLNLTSEQTAKINALREANLREVKPLQDKMFSKRGELRLLWLQQNPDQDKILAVQKEIRVLRDQIQDKRDSYRLQVYNTLTPEQKSQYQSFGRGRGFGPGMRGGSGWQSGPCNYGSGPGAGMMRGNW